MTAAFDTVGITRPYLTESQKIDIILIAIHQIATAKPTEDGYDSAKAVERFQRIASTGSES